MRVYHSYKQAKRLRDNAKKQGYDRIFIILNRAIPETHLFKDNIIEADEFDKQTQTYIINTGYGNMKIWKSMAREVL